MIKHSWPTWPFRSIKCLSVCWILLLAVVAACGSPPPEASEVITPTPQVEATVLGVWAEESTIEFVTEALGGKVELKGTYGANGGTVTLIPEDGELRINAFLLIDTTSVTAGNAMIDEVLRVGIDATTYPTAIFDAQSTALIPFTEEPVAFALAGTLTMHGETRPVTMQVGPATLIDHHLVARATMAIDLSDFGITLPEAVVSSAIVLTVELIADVNPPA